ncbi:MAG: ABC transporter ATP-binding protein [Micrococcales bacterium 73-15]|uniref:ABC transporter ATP-binding protein n=1 Tax=Salana multivorans TaxID=120377 RepID=UPI000965B3C3|nr:ATP-binding cassette domain-containing protein [Salana multivorans]OJX97830.1 MAG: ABC transporter ATP-binding protein [Micrococcales bacterium 73-15]
MLSLTDVTKTFGERRALDGVTFDVAPGRLTGFVGGNGAGKTTAMRILLGVLAPTSGTATIDGRPITGDDRRGFGYMPEERGLYPKMAIGEQLAYLARLHGIDRTSATKRAMALLERFDLAARAKDNLDSLSLGNQQRVQVAAALVHTPEVLVLDEPFSGLDPLAVDEVVSVVAEHAARGIPVLFSSHQLDVVERLCDDLVIIAGGRIRARGTRDGLRAEHAGNRWAMAARGDAGWVRGVPGVVVDELAGDHVTFAADDAAAQLVLTEAVGRGGVTSFTPVRPTLGEIFRDVIRDEADDTTTDPTTEATTKEAVA